MQDNFVADQYDVDVKKRQAGQSAAFVLSRILRAIFYIVKLFLTIILGVVKGVARTFGLPVK